MKKLYLPLLLAISFVSKAQILDSTKVENAKVYSLKIANPIVNKPMFFKETQNEGNDIQKNLNQDRKSTRLNSSHLKLSRMPSSA